MSKARYALALAVGAGLGGALVAIGDRELARELEEERQLTRLAGETY